MVYRRKYTWCQIFNIKKDNSTGFHALGSQIIEEVEAQMTLGHFYLVRHNNFTYDIITEIKRALHSQVLLPHVFSFQDYSDL